MSIRGLIFAFVLGAGFFGVSPATACSSNCSSQPAIVPGASLEMSRGSVDLESQSGCYPSPCIAGSSSAARPVSFLPMPRGASRSYACGSGSGCLAGTEQPAETCDVGMCHNVAAAVAGCTGGSNCRKTRAPSTDICPTGPNCRTTSRPMSL